MDGLERLTFSFQVHASDQLSSAKLRVGIITGVVCVAFVVIRIFFCLFLKIYICASNFTVTTTDMIVFRPFVSKLREESEHTFSIIRMIPRKMLTDVEEIQEFIQESIDSNKD